jgi:hypothetical protein
MASAGGGWPGERHLGGVANRARCRFCGAAAGPFAAPDRLLRAPACVACQPVHRVDQGSKRLDHKQPKHHLVQVCLCASAPVRMGCPRAAAGGCWAARRVVRRVAGRAGPGDGVLLASLVRLALGPVVRAWFAFAVVAGGSTSERRYAQGVLPGRRGDDAKQPADQPCSVRWGHRGRPDEDRGASSGVARWAGRRGSGVRAARPPPGCRYRVAPGPARR